GFTMHLPEKDNGHMTKRKMEESIIVLLGGRVAEKIILDDITTGASNDIERASKTARDMVTRYGFSKKLGPILYGSEDHEVFLGRDYSQGRNYSEKIASEIDEEVMALVNEGFESAERILTEHKDMLELCAQYLMRHEKIDGADFYKLINHEIDLDGKPIKSAEEIPASEEKPQETQASETQEVQGVQNAASDEAPADNGSQSE
ncbi:MAG: ATP-dependent zinc metalloprotease FtsH, partial [Oscillospiraceae bacterium]